MLNHLATRLLSGERIELVLQDVASALLAPFGLVRCEIQATMDGGPGLDVAAPSTRVVEEGDRDVVPITAGGGLDVGMLTAIRPPGARPLQQADRRWLEACAQQIAVAIERERLDAEVAAARIEAQTNELRAALFSSVTHDLRTPLSSIKASVTSLLDDSLHRDPEGRRELLTTVLEETDRLNLLVGNLLDLARVRAGALTPSKQLTHVDDILESVLHRMRERLEPYRMRTVVRPDVPAIPVDAVQIDQMLTNLLENAARFSPSNGEILVSVAWVGDAVQIRIADQGPGIPAVDRGRVFEAFFRRDAGPGRGGTGLGLAIAQAIVVAHGGRIWIDDAPGGGTAVLFELPTESEGEAG